MTLKYNFLKKPKMLHQACSDFYRFFLLFKNDLNCLELSGGVSCEAQGFPLK